MSARHRRVPRRPAAENVGVTHRSVIRLQVGQATKAQWMKIPPSMPTIIILLAKVQSETAFAHRFSLLPCGRQIRLVAHSIFWSCVSFTYSVCTSKDVAKTHLYGCTNVFFIYAHWILFIKVKQGQARLNAFAIKALEHQHSASPVAAKNDLATQHTSESTADTRTAKITKLRLERMPAG